MNTFTPDCDAMREAGQLSADLDPLPEWDPKWIEKFATLVRRTYENKALDPKLAALVRLNLDVSATHLYAPGVRRHIREAVRLGATRAEILEVFKVAAVIGIHSSALAAPLLKEELKKQETVEESATHHPEPDSTPRIDAARAAGQFNPLWELLYQWEPEWLEAFVDMGLGLWDDPVLPPLWIELLCIAGDAEVTHMFAPGTQRHIQNALKLGATREQILAVLQIGGLIGIESCELGVAILKEELEGIG
jgi:alkylhydroperoxidase/carboxymuconolactone decarboxylase family protein YurZ